MGPDPFVPPFDQSWLDALRTLHQELLTLGLAPPCASATAPLPEARRLGHAQTLVSSVASEMGLPRGFPGVTTTIGLRLDRDTAKVRDVELVCPACRSDRAIPMTFAPSELIEIVVDTPDRPLAECAECGYWLSTREVEAQKETQGG